ncbi:sensor domain-containing diguanylate cyclase/phosphohydrolase [Natranaerobius thermophilus]|uniref:Diguanylate cyclase and metal dependent phosphohydrolase n=1 Tax=Natranaerobius thermophilus (strain ATCC BAA-1301 / DSM 18059 / JW/NM-WN-LF) TaxID=457570 RepID=B2A7R8_NATTJ|nr:HD domain-containing phosphohydrolase [Natranaerobius thermophilus]ACB84370.1 diguanylate cyclase and metal dependent phosphohydrolase [Natranaerobius thermophilus JW/NM-WN-LF]
MTIEHKQAEEELRLSEEKFRRFIENASDIVFTLDKEGYLTFVSPNWKQLLGHDPENVVGNHYKEFVHSEDIEKVIAKHKELLETGTLDSEIEYRVRHKSGEWKWHASRINIMESDENRVVILGVARDITLRKEAESKIRYLSFHDSLTGLYNRAYLDEQIKQLNNKHFYPLSVIMADLNGLKLVNDTYGHLAGDEMLKKAASSIKNSIRKNDIVARWGGDEFLILLPQTNKQDAKKLSERLLDSCKNQYVQDVPISLAVGRATITKPENDDEYLTKTLIEAEDDMYKQKLANSRSARSSILTALLKTLEAKSFETESHTVRMRNIAKQIGKKIGLSDSELNKLNLLITLHDIGKINIPEDILSKQGKLTEKEWETIKTHPLTGYRIALATEEFAHVAEGILSHHERWDGKGYPQGLKEKEIPLLARITTIADAYEVMTNGRPYQKPMTQGEIIEEFKRCSGSQFDPELVQAFLEILTNTEIQL